MRIALSVFGRELIALELGSSDPSDEDRFADHVGQVTGFSVPVRAPYDVDMPERDV